MSLAHAILGWLHKEPMTGYDLKKQFDQGVAYFWPADQMQIYRTLDRLVEHGQVSVHEEIQHHRPNRKVYTVTDAGRKELRHWLGEPQTLPSLRDPLLMQIFFAAILANAEIIELLEQQRREHRKLLTTYQQMVLFPLDTPVGDGSVSRRKMLQRLTLEHGIKREQAYLEWLEETIDVVHRFPEQKR